MARVDSILSIVVQHGANELRMGTDREPKMLAFGAPKKLSLAATPDAALRALLGDILSPEREAALRAGGSVEVDHHAGALGPFVATFAKRDDGFDVVFLRGKAQHDAKPATPAAAPAVEPPAKPQAGRTRLAELLARAASLGASDLHLADGEPPFVRVDGELRALTDESLADVAGTIVLDEAAKQRLVTGHSADLALDVAGVGRVRANVYRASEKLAAAVRLMPGTPPTLASLHMPLPLDDLTELPHGLVIVCGATGSGKSTTVAALAQEALEKRSILLITLEDPIEYALTAGARSLVRRREVGRDARDFAAGLRDALREDPDVLVVGEMRDPETISLALTAAETGHLVLASMHSGSTSSAIERIVDSYPPERQRQIRVQLADALRAVVAQRLLPRAQGGGRVPAVELLRVTHAVASMIREGKTAHIQTVLQSGRREGMITLERSLAERVQAGMVREEHARAAANDPTSFTTYLGR